MDPQQSSPDDDRRFPWGLVALFGLAAALWLGWWWFVYVRFTQWSEAGDFSAAFGGIEALFSALALGGIIYTIVLQRKELSYQRRELAGQREQMVTQNATLLQQQFDSTFFQLLRLHHDIVNGMVYLEAGGGRPLEGREVFGAVRRFVRNAMPPALEKYPIEIAPVEMWEQAYQEFQAYLGHYFRNFYHLIKLVHETKVPIDKARYMGLARAQLSTDEHIALFYNAIGRIGRRRFKALIEQYHLMENLHVDAISEPRVLALFRRGAYGDDVGRIEELLRRVETPWVE